ncbi:hypothetical protein OJF2_27810 [Aquisphaera giovannonii]|uniref:DUF155 domain-containing protein n=1 Tax=Aquisphaera giovannonii TaxID=406548 RepID=A0A5B9W0V2_9BACT|nr:hypothetical protein [Aquisphaera giovannonii]QEH34246.1 hypothetical protein OJF2_27810 [Aquisphaera giovannonii]
MNAETEMKAGPEADWIDAPQAVVVHFAFALDIGDEIDLDAARNLLQGEPGVLPRRRRTPGSIGYRPAPIRVPVDPDGIRLPGAISPAREPSADLSLFDFGAISLAVRFPLIITPRALRDLAGDLADPAELNDAARRRLAPWIDRLRPAVYDFAPSELSEEYIVFQLAEARSNWLSSRAGWIAGLVRLESEPLSLGEVAEATRLAISYTPDDLVLLDWAAGFIADADCEDTLRVIEFANVQLLEFRHIDDRLDDRLEAAYKLIRPERRRGRWLSAWKGHEQAVRHIRELEIEAASLFERVDNALKLVGDHYLSRVFELASSRFHLRGWQQSIRRKLETVGDVYDLLIQQAGGHRMEALEITVVILIALEILLALWRH